MSWSLVYTRQAKRDAQKQACSSNTHLMPGKLGLESRKGSQDITDMSPTVFRWKGYRFFFFSREERRMHVHVTCAEGEAKFWLEPAVELARNYRLSSSQIAATLAILEERKDEIVTAWRRHFRR